MTNRIKGARMNPLARKEQILQTALDISIEKGYRNVTRIEIARRMQCAKGLITHYYKGIENLRKIVLQSAIQREIIPILAQNLAVWGEETAQLTPELKQKVLKYLTN